MVNPKVSILIYVKNDESHIVKCIRSVMGQSLHDIEILVIDGGSTDGTLDKIEALVAEDDRIRVILSQPGVGIQFNTGLKISNGQYIGICESDDYIPSDMYERQYKIAEGYQLDVLKANVTRFCTSKKEEHRFLFSLSNDLMIYDKLLFPQEDFSFLKLGVNGFWSGLYRREFLTENNLYMNETDGASYQDTTFSFLTEAYAKKAYIMKEAFYCYRMDNPNSSINNPKKLSLLNTEYELLKDRLKIAEVWEKYKEVYLSWKLSGHLWFYDNLSNDIKNDYITFFYQDIINEIGNEEYTGSELSIKEKAIYITGHASFDEFKKYVSSVDADWLQTEKKLNQLILSEKILVFGAGNLGVIVNRYLNERNIKAEACLDNDTHKWNNNINDLLVLSPNEAVKKYPNAVYIIANATYDTQMKKQLMDLGVKEPYIIICNNYDMFLKKILIKTIKENARDKRGEV
jgi:glycosyltransferase involved in cell wall biosynthesis